MEEKNNMTAPENDTENLTRDASFVTSVPNFDPAPDNITDSSSGVTSDTSVPDEASDTRARAFSVSDDKACERTGVSTGGRRDSGTRRLITLAALVAVAMILSFVESRIPSFVAIPGIKLGLANIAVVFCLYRLGTADAAIVSVVRVMLSSLLFGTLTSFLYGLSGAVLSFVVMLLMKRLGTSPVFVSTLGGVSHNIAQIAVASLLLQTNVVGYYLPFLVLSGTISGIVIGVAGGVLVTKLPNIK